jgi:NAD(P)H-dependent FMN reductase
LTTLPSHPHVRASLLDRRLLRLPGLDSAAFDTGVLEHDPDVRHLRERLASAQAVVLVTPVNHGSYAGGLKNLLDHAPRRALQHKAALVAAAGSTLHPGATACDHLRAVVRSMGAWTVPTQLIAERADLAGGEVPQRLAARIDRAVGELMLVVSLLAPSVV